MQFDLDLDHNISDSACTTAMSQSMENENATCEMLNFGCRFPPSFAGEKIGHIFHLKHSTQAVLISEASMEYCMLTVICIANIVGILVLPHSAIQPDSSS